MSSQSAVLTAALGSIVGYVGSEVAEVVNFERLLWPQRFYNDLTFAIAVQHGLLGTMGGPLHSAALKTLDVFRTHGLYRGFSRGHFLGTAFFADYKLKSSMAPLMSEAVDTEDREIRNAFWLEVARQIDRESVPHDIAYLKRDVESDQKSGAATRRFRSIHAVHHFRLRLVPETEVKQALGVPLQLVTEDSVTWKTVLSVFISELVAIGVGIASIFLGSWWMVIVMAIPLILKILAVLLSVRRESLAPKAELKMKGRLDQNRMVEIFGFEQGFLLLEGPDPALRQFFEHYGHPLRNRRRSIFGDRFREVGSIALVYCFVFYFPAGLLLTTWQSDAMQYLWLAYQLYSVVAMHVVRLFDLQGCGRTEQRVARYLCQGKKVWLQSSADTTSTIEVSVKTDLVGGYSEGKNLVKDTINRHVSHSNDDLD